MVRFRLVAAAFLATGLAGAAQAQDVEAGKKVFARCAVCHNVDKTANKVGPHLVNLIGRKAGAIEGYTYSAPHKNSGLTWDEPTLDRYLTDPKAVIPGNKMVFPGVKVEAERKNLIAYLVQATKQ